MEMRAGKLCRRLSGSAQGCVKLSRTAVVLVLAEASVWGQPGPLHRAARYGPTYFLRFNLRSALELKPADLVSGVLWKKTQRRKDAKNAMDIKGPPGWLNPVDSRERGRSDSALPPLR